MQALNSELSKSLETGQLLFRGNTMFLWVVGPGFSGTPKSSWVLNQTDISVAQKKTQHYQGKILSPDCKDLVAHIQLSAQ